MRKFKSKKGFTLAELLGVVAIISVLAAIAIPVFGSQLTKAKLAADHAAIRDAYALVQIANNLQEVEINGVTKTFDELGNENLLCYLSEDCSSLASYPLPDGFITYILKEDGAEYSESCPTCAQWDTPKCGISKMHQKGYTVCATYLAEEKKLFLGYSLS